MERLTRAAAWAVIAGTALVAGCRTAENRFAAEAVRARPAGSAEAAPAGPLDLELSLARTLERDGDLVRATAAYRRILERHPDQPAATHRLAVVLDRSQRFEESGPLFERAVDLAPENPELLCDYAYSLYSQNRCREAEDLLRRSLAVAPDHRRSHSHLGLVLARTGRRDEALRSFHAAGCSAAEAHENVGLVLSLDGRFAEARTEYLAALEVAPSSGSSRTRLQELDAIASVAAAQSGDSEGEGDAQPYPDAAPGDPHERSAGRAVVRLTAAESPSSSDPPAVR